MKSGNLVIMYTGTKRSKKGENFHDYNDFGKIIFLNIQLASLRERPLQNGNVITVEPGLYFANLGIGVRIEDDVLIEDGKAIVLSRNIAKEIDDIERLFKSKGR